MARHGHLLHLMRGNKMTPEMVAAMWAGDDETLQKIAKCMCCCDEHTSERCPARAWSGCLGNGAWDLTIAEIDEWARHYERHHGMSRAQFLGMADDAPASLTA